MKKNMIQVLILSFFVLCSFVATACTDEGSCFIDKAEFKRADKIRVYISNLPDSDTEISFCIEVYVNEKLDNDYYIKNTSVASWDFYADITINKDIPIGATVTIKPSYTSNKLEGSVTITRE